MKAQKGISFIISFIYAAYLVAIFLSNYCYYKSTLAESGRITIYSALSYINKAIFLNPLNSEYHYQKYYLLNDKYNNAKGFTKIQRLGILEEAIKEIQKAIELEPARASYHMFYGLALIKKYPNSYKNNPLIVAELRRACELKPFSKKYREIFKTYIN